MKTLEIEALLENLETVQGFIVQELEEAMCPPKVTIQLEIAIEEIYVNICHYAYSEGEYAALDKKAVINCEIREDPRTLYMEYIDWGKPFNPLAKEDADITLSVEERQIGGLGILMVKKTMDSMEYRREDGKNILSMVKTF